jgi:hypothetical protein
MAVGRLIEQVPRDDQPLHFVDAFADHRQQSISSSRSRRQFRPSLAPCRMSIRHRFSPFDPLKAPALLPSLSRIAKGDGPGMDRGQRCRVEHDPNP